MTKSRQTMSSCTRIVRCLGGIALLWGVASSSGGSVTADEPTKAVASPASTPVTARPALVWLDAYEPARDAAKAARRLLLLEFHDAERDAAFAKLRQALQADDELAPQLASWTLCSLATDATVTTDGETTRLLDHPAFAEMHGKPGLIMIDYRDEKAAHFGQVVTVFPIGREGAKYRPAAIAAEGEEPWIVPRNELRVLVDLPPGTLTQRTLIFAVRCHSERPESASGEFHEVLASETESHSSYQAEIRVQGHHSWDRRFHRINARLPNGLLAVEVCAESWPGQPLLEAARECVHSWRQSSGHWNAVHSKHRVFGYDMKRGSNGIWYATGIFGRGG